MPTAFSSFCFREGLPNGGRDGSGGLPVARRDRTAYDGFPGLRDRDGGLWIGALGGGLAHLHEGKIDQFSQSDGLSSDSVAGLFRGSRRQHLGRLRTPDSIAFANFPVTPFTMRQGFSSLRVLAVVASTDGSMWVRTVDGVNQWKDGHVTVYREFPHLSNRDDVACHACRRRPATPTDVREIIRQVSGGSLFQDERGRIWVVDEHESVGYLDRGRFVAVPSVPGGRVHSITGDLKGNLWFAHETQGLFHLAGERVVEQISWAQPRTRRLRRYSCRRSFHGRPVAWILSRRRRVREGRSGPRVVRSGGRTGPGASQRSSFRPRRRAMGRSRGRRQPVERRTRHDAVLSRRTAVHRGSLDDRG